MSDGYDLFENAVVREQRDKFFRALHEGESLDCPCCGRYAQIYKRRIHSSMALQLIELFKISRQRGNDYVHASEFAMSTGVGDVGKFRHWGLIEAKPNDEDSKKNSGFWRITAKGLRFVIGEIQVPAWAMMYDNEALSFSVETVSIQDALGTKFDYQELMKGE